MKILELAEFYSNYSGNFIPTLENFESKLKNFNHEVFYIFSNRNDSEAFHKWYDIFKYKHNVILLNYQSKDFIKTVVNYIVKNNIQIVHGHFLSSNLFSKIKKRSPRSVLFFQHIHNSFYTKKSVFAFAKRIRNYLFLSKEITKICCSASISNSAAYTFPKSKIEVCKNSIDLARLKKETSLKTDNFSILLLGHNYFIKGVDVAIQAVSELSKEMNIHLDIVMGDHLEKNISIIKEKYGKIPNCISILQPTLDIVNLYQSHQVFLNASIEEGMSYANIEAYYCGALTILSNIPQNIEPNLPNVLYFNSGEVNSLKEALKKAYTIKETYSNNPNYVEENFSLDRWSNEIIKLIGLS